MPIPKLTRRGSRVYGEIKEKARERWTRLRLPAWRRWKMPPLNYKKIVQVVGLGILACFIIGTGVVAWVSRDLPDPNKLTERQVAESTKIYDRTGEHLLYEVYQDEKRTVVELDQVAPLAVKAIVAVEDKHFYEHKGIRIVSILRAGVNNIFNRVLGVVGITRRTGSGGASTISQQFIKNTIVGDERRGIQGYFRKIKEIILAIQMERVYTKDQIMKSYLNEIGYGSTNYGIESASQSYFKKSAKDLTLAESATLAALPKSPTRLLNNLPALKERRNLVLYLMHQQEYISEEEKNSAQKEELKIAKDKGLREAPHFVLYVKQLLAEEFGDKLVDTGGLKVITTLDFTKQQIAEKAVKENGDKFAKESNANNASLVAIDPKNSQILAMVGSRDFYNEEIDGQFNVAVLGKRQPGSSFKPFVYTAAFEKGYTPNTVLYDVATDFDVRGGAKYRPRNANGKEYGLLTMRKALQGSLNIPAVKVLYLVGTKEAIDFAKRFGYTTFTGDYGLSLVLGGAEVNLLEHTNAYAALADNGRYHAPVSILKVTDTNGEVLREWKESEGTEAVKPELAALTTSILTDNNARAYIFGASNNLILSGRPVAAKTGTTNDAKDAWTMGYTPSLASGVWVGNTIPAQMKGGGIRLAGVIWNQFMREALKGTPVEHFPAPPAITAEKPVLRGTDGGVVLPINRITGKIATSSTPAEFIAQKTFLPPHDILHYVRRDDPAGPPPENPADDPQYANWEWALQQWVVRQQATGTLITLEEPPTEYDSPQSLELLPQLTIISPANGQAVTARDMQFQVNASAPRGVSLVVYYVDGLQVGSNTQYPFSLSYSAKYLSKGAHTLKVIAQDDMGNAAQQEITFDLQAEADSPSMEWSEPNPMEVVTVDFPRPVHLRPFRWEDIKEIKIYLQSTSGEKLIYTFFGAEDKLVNQQLMFTWNTYPGAGNYTLRAVMTDKAGRMETRDLAAVAK